MDQPINLKFDGTFDLATGRSRNETNWKNKETTWSSFVERLSITHRTAETLSEYMGFKKTLQDERKDVGGFVGGYVNNGRRKAENIPHRQLATLDIDFSKGGLWDDFLITYPNSAVIYSTHKHSPENPRLRLIIPLDRPVSTDEYVAITRRIAGDLDINTFDDTTFEPNRLMFWPSTSKDGEFVFEYQDGPWLCADEVLARYKNWQDASEWPVSDRAGEIIHRDIKKQGDPLEKPGVVGAFCRTYDIHEAIETFLPDEYEPCDVEDRYTFKQGSTAAGAIVYDDKFIFSHHGTDPASGKLCNAFDLVRLHLYGLQDEDAKEGTPSHKLPSYLDMSVFASKDPKVRKRLGAERRQEAKEDFGDGYGDQDEQDTTESDDWQEKLEIDRKGKLYNTTNNYLLILQNDPKLKGFALNAFSNTKVVIYPLPWREIKDLSPWRDSDFDSLFAYIEKHYQIANEANLRRSHRIVLDKRKFNPVFDFLKFLIWDGEKRLENIFIEYLGAEDNPYTRAVTRISLVAAVARIFQPGIPYDQVVILAGGQGIGKSTILRKLGKHWFSDNFSLHGNNSDIEQILGRWIIEIGELAGFRLKEVTDIKNYISRTHDETRLAYATEKQIFPRQCVFFGTTNENNFLTDATGNRRFWPVKVEALRKTKNLWEDLSEYEIDQIWAESVHYFKKGESLVLAKELIGFANSEQESHTQKDERIGTIQEYLDKLLPENWPTMNLFERRKFIEGDELQPLGTIQRQKISIMEIWTECFCKNKADLGRRESVPLHNIMRGLEGWGLSPNSANGPEKVAYYNENEIEIEKYGKKQICYVRSNITVKKAVTINKTSLTNSLN